MIVEQLKLLTGQSIIMDGAPKSITTAMQNGVVLYLYELVQKLYAVLLLAAAAEAQAVPRVRHEGEMFPTGSGYFITGNVNYLWRKIASIYIRKNVNTIMNLTDELKAVVYDSKLAGGSNVVTREAVN